MLSDRLVAEIAHVGGGGEGVLPLLVSLCERYCRTHAIAELEWIVHAVACANPNLRLRAALERRGFVQREVPGVGLAYRRVERVAA